jgi:hypothetical protein
MATPSPFSTLVPAATDRPGIAALLTALGFQAGYRAVPRRAWSLHGLPMAPDLAGVAVAGRAGSLEALLVELRSQVSPERCAELAAAVRRRNPVRLRLLVFRGAGAVVLGSFGEAGEFRHLLLEPDRVSPSDLEALEEMAARPGETGLALALRQARALDRTRVTRLFFRDFRAHRAAVAAAFLGVPAEAERERAQLAILFLCRLTFLYFLQRRGTLGGDDRYLVRLFAARDTAGGGTFFRARLLPLFFGALNRPAAERSPAALALGALPYLNGGLFEPHVLERRYPDLDLPDPVVRSVLEGLLERYRFTTREAGTGAGYGLDPEVLGQVFEGLMAAAERVGTGSFYTPAPVVNRVVRAALAEYVAASCPGVDPGAALGREAARLPVAARHQVRRALERVRVLDPACGSGTFLLGALHHLSATLASVSDAPEASVRRELVAGSLHGVDLLDDAALLCSLRIWLALSEAEHPVRPLPNLDGRIRQGDALVEPFDLAATDLEHGAGAGPLGDPDLRRAHRTVATAARRYLESSPATRVGTRAALLAAERHLAQRWLARARQLQEHRVRRLRAEAGDRDLFGEPPEHARRARAALRPTEARQAELDAIDRHLQEKGALPFFSFGVHFADAGGEFDFIISNPPWVRAHRWPERVRRLAARHYEVCRAGGWRGAPHLNGVPPAASGQLDLSLLFLERSCRLLAPGGVLAILLPAKSLRALYGGGARQMLLRDLEFGLIEDHALDHRSMFRADAFVAVLVLRRPRSTEPGGGAAGGVQVRMVRRGVAPLDFRVRQRELPLYPDAAASPWVLAPEEVVRVMRRMQEAGAPLGRHRALRLRRGIMTGANDVLVMRAAAPGLGGLTRVEAVGYEAARRRGAPGRLAGRFRAWVEAEALRPLVRGADVDAFRYRAGAHVVWCHDERGSLRPPPPRMERYLLRHRQALEARPGWRPGRPLGSIFRLSPDTLLPKVAWHDLSDTLRGVALPARVESGGAMLELIPLNTVYFVPVQDERDALLLAAIMNSLPASIFVRAIAERAKDARFRFFAWTVACLPLPADWREHPASRDLVGISRAAHAREGLDPAARRQLDRAAAALYRLDATMLDPLHRFDRWLRGEP